MYTDGAYMPHTMTGGIGIDVQSLNDRGNWDTILKIGLQIKCGSSMLAECLAAYHGLAIVNEYISSGRCDDQFLRTVRYL